MPKRNAEEPTTPKKRRSIEPPSDTKIPKIEPLAVVEKSATIVTSPSAKADKKRKRSVDEGERSTKTKVEKFKEQQGGNDILKSKNEADEAKNFKSKLVAPRSIEKPPRFTVNRADPVGLEAIKVELFEHLQKLPGVPDAEYVNGIRKISDGILDDDTFSKRVLLDTYVREFLMNHLLPAKEPWENLVKMSIEVSREGLMSAHLPITLLVDLIDLTGLEECESIFKFIEERLELWKEDHFFNTCKNAVLRMCNDLLRRLSQTQNTIFCGRILIFLSNYFPFSERSGLNVMSEFNLENVTVYKTGDGSDDTEDKMEVVQEKEEKLFEGMNISIPGLEQVVAQCQEQKKKNLTLDYNMYVKFWSLQDFLRNPVQCYNKVNWKTFSLYTTDLLEAFKSAKLLPVPESNIEAEEVEMPEILETSEPEALSPLPQIVTTFDIPRVGDERLYFAKYLTNRRVLELEMSDPGFRRSLMVQLLIVLQYLTLPIKFKHESHVLNEEQLEYVKKTNEKVYEILLDIKPGGKAFVDTVKHILKREEFWNKWKNDGCPSMKKPVPPITVTTDPRVSKGAKPGSSKDNGIGEDFEESPPVTPRPPVKQKPSLGIVLKNFEARNKYILGNKELNRLWNICPDNLTACRSKTRNFMPSIEGYFGEAMKELDPEPITTYDPKKEVKHKKILGNANFGWRGLRLLSRRSPYFFQMVSGTPIHPLQSYLEFVLKKIAIDMETSASSTSAAEDMPKIKVEAAGSDNTPAAGTPNGANEETEMVTAEDDDEEELSRPEGSDEIKDEEEGEVKADIRSLTEDEQEKLGKSLGADWKKLAAKLGYSQDEMDYFETEKKECAGAYMLKLWTEQDQDDATIADLLYTLEGLGLLSKAEGIIAVT